MKCNKMYLPGLLFVYLLLGACTHVKDLLGMSDAEIVLTNQTKTYVYECPEGYSFTASIDGKQAWVILPDQTIKLSHVPSASGAKYIYQQTTFWSKGNEARLEHDSHKYLACKNNRAKAIWEHAKLSGVDFRALGNEPSWVLEIVNGNTIIFSTYFDRINVHVFKRPEPEVDQSTPKTRYTTKNELHKLIVTIIGKPCEDTMSGESFESSVKIELDDKLFIGCGRALH